MDTSLTTCFLMVKDLMEEKNTAYTQAISGIDNIVGFNRKQSCQIKTSSQFRNAHQDLVYSHVRTSN